MCTIRIKHSQAKVAAFEILLAEIEISYFFSISTLQ